MLKRRLGVLALALGMIGSAGYAQRKPASKPARPVSKAATPSAEQVSLGTTGGGTAAIPRDRFLQEMAKPLQTAHGRVEGFTFMYGERNMYEDSAGNPLLVTDYLTQYCTGDTLPGVIRATLTQRCKAGDTAYYNGIKILKEDGMQAPGRDLKITITR